MRNRIRDEVCLRQNPCVEDPDEIGEDRKSLNRSSLVNPVGDSRDNRTEYCCENYDASFHIGEEDLASEFFGESEWRENEIRC